MESASIVGLVTVASGIPLRELFTPRTGAARSSPWHRLEALVRTMMRFPWSLADCHLVRPLFGPPSNSLKFCDDSLCEAGDVELVPVAAACQAQRQQGLGVDEHPATLLPAGDPVDCDRVTTHAWSVAQGGLLPDHGMIAGLSGRGTVLELKRSLTRSPCSCCPPLNIPGIRP